VGNTYGPATVESVGFSIQVTADGRPDWKAGGVTVAWDLVAALGVDTTFDDGVICLAGEKVLRYGQVVCRVTTGELQTVTIGGGATGGTFTLTLSGQTTGAIAWNAAAATVQAALVALSTVGTGKATVAGSAGGPWTVTFDPSLGDVALMTGSAASLTGGTPTLTIATLETGLDSGLFGPYDPAAVDGRQSLNRGDCFIVNSTMRELDPKSNHPAVFSGGRVFINRVLNSGVATHTLALGPTLAEVYTAFPRLIPVND
jgi:hypothetical protein